MALGTPVLGTIGYPAVAQGATVAPTYPAGIGANDGLILFVYQKPETEDGGGVTTPSGWTLRYAVEDVGGYTGAPAADVGDTSMFAYTKDSVTGSESGTLVVDWTDPNTGWAAIVLVPSDTGVAYAASGGSDSSGGNVSVTLASDPGFAAGDRAVWAWGQPTDVTTPAQFSGHAITATGATFAAATELGEPDTSVGADAGGFLAWTSVSTGPSSAAAVITATAGGTTTNVRGPLVCVRVREQAGGSFSPPRHGAFQHMMVR